MNYDFWKQQAPDNPLFPDIEWSKPERRDQAGKLAIIGGNKLGFSGVAAAFADATSTGVGEVRVLLPDVLQKTIPKTMLEAVFAASNPSGGLAKDALPAMKATGDWADQVLLIGDAGRNSETAIVYEEFLSDYSGQLTVTRDAVDLLRHGSLDLVERKDTLLVVSFAQLQKLFQAIYYPKMVTFSMQLTQLVETLHKFTISYPTTIVVLHQETLLAAHDGEVTTTPWNNPMALWHGSVATKAAAYTLWNRSQPLAATTASFVV